MITESTTAVADAARPEAGDAPWAASHRGVRAALSAASLVAVLAWVYWPSILAMVHRWSSDPRYTHGFLVPVFSAWLLWERRGRLDPGRSGPNWLGVPCVLAAVGLKFAGSYYYLQWFDMISLVISSVAVAMLLGGVPALRWAWPSITFLVFMIPLPYRAEVALGAPLQSLASAASAYALQACGVCATLEGNVIVLDDAKINVAESCNGMGMTYMFLAFSAGVALVLRLPALDRLLIVVGAIPTALLANLARITATGLLHVSLGGVVADAVYHDLAGWLMMPIALLAIALELRLLSLLFVESAPLEAGHVELVEVASRAADPRAGADRRKQGRFAP
jgi:exosortase